MIEEQLAAPPLPVVEEQPQIDERIYIEATGHRALNAALKEVERVTTVKDRPGLYSKIAAEIGPSSPVWERALSAAEEVEQNDSYDRDTAYIDISSAALEAGNLEIAQRSAEKIVYSNNRALRLMYVAEAGGHESSAWGPALSAAIQGEKEDDRSSFLYDVALKSATAGRADIALEAAKHLKKGWSEEVYINLAEAEGPESPHWEAALKNIEHSGDAIRIVEAAQRVGASGIGERAIAKIKNDDVRAQARLAGMEGSDSPRWQAALEEVKKNAASEDKTGDYDYTQLALLEASVKAGRLDIARQVAGLVDTLRMRSDALLQVAEAEGPESQYWQKALEAVPQKTSIDGGHYLRITKAAVAAGKLDFAKHVASQPMYEGNIQEAYTAVAEAEGPGSPYWEKLLDLTTDPRKDAELSRAEALQKKINTLERIGTKQGASSSAWEEALTLALKPREMSVHDEEMITRACSSLAIAAATAGNPKLARDISKLGSYVSGKQMGVAIAIAQAEGPDSNLWDGIMQHANAIDDPKDKSRVYGLIAAAAIEAGKLDLAWQIDTDLTDDYPYPESKVLRLIKLSLKAKELSGEGLTAEELRGRLDQKASPQLKRDIGALMLEQWDSFKGYDQLTFARLINGAAQIANAYMDPDERKKFIRHLAGEFREFTEKGMFEDGQHSQVAKNMTEALASLEDPGAIGELLQTLYKNMGEAVGLRIIRNLVNTGNAKAVSAGIDVMLNTDTPPHAYQYLLQKLAKGGYIDEALPSHILELQKEGIPAHDSRYIMSYLYADSGIQSDSEMLSYTIEQMREKYAYVPGEGHSIDVALELFIEEVNKHRQEFERFSAPELLKYLNDNEEAAKLYFLLNGGRTRYTLINHYNYSKFRDSLKVHQDVRERVNPDACDPALFGGNEEWQQAMLARRRPSPDLIWEVQIGQSSQELSETARAEFQQIIGEQLAWLVAQEEMPSTNLADFNGFDIQNLDPKMLKRLKGLLGSQLFDVAAGRSDFTPSIGDLDKIKPGIISALRELRKNSKNQNPADAENWKALISELEAADPVRALRALPAILKRNPAFALRPAGGLAEWIGHLDGLGTSLREARVNGAEQRQITLRWLDNKEDLCELVRFADGAQCCFTSEDTAGVEMDRGGGYRARIGQDPLWFAIAVEDTPQNAEQRIASGFVFGSLGWVDGQPAVILNGVYMQRKTPAATNRILDEIFERVARPLGITQMVVAAMHGGKVALDTTKWQPASGHQMNRVRAMRGEFRTYDDIGTQVNQEYTINSNSLWLRREAQRNS